jgi:hypothetical protein
LNGLKLHDVQIRAIPADSIRKKSPENARDLEKKRKSSKRKDSLYVQSLALKYWKALYLQKKCRLDFAQFAKTYNVLLNWRTDRILDISGKADQVKSAKGLIEGLVAKHQVFSQLVIPCPDSSYRVRVLNECRIFEKQGDVALIIEKLTENELKEDAQIIKVTVVAKTPQEFETVKSQLTNIPKAMFERKMVLSKKEATNYKDLKEKNGPKLAALKKQNKVYGVKILKGRLILRGTSKEGLADAEAELQKLIGDGTTAASKPAAVEPVKDAFVSLDSIKQIIESNPNIAQFRADLNRGSIRKLDPKILSALKQEFLSPSPEKSPSKKESEVDKDEPEVPPENEDDAIPEETVNLNTKTAEFESMENELDADLPETWDPMPELVNSVAVIIESDSDEWNLVQNSFDFPVNILSIERVQNKVLYRRYLSQKKELELSKSSTEISYLWSGTMGCVPEDLYENPEGFDMEFSGQGVFQFWRKASYGAVFAYSTTDGSKQMFLAEVLAGKVTRMQVQCVPAYPTYLITFRQPS